MGCCTTALSIRSGSRHPWSRFVIHPIEGFDRLSVPGGHPTPARGHPFCTYTGKHSTTYPRKHYNTHTLSKRNRPHISRAKGRTGFITRHLVRGKRQLTGLFLSHSCQKLHRTTRYLYRIRSYVAFGLSGCWRGEDKHINVSRATGWFGCFVI